MNPEDTHAGIPGLELATDDNVDDVQFMAFLTEIAAEDGPAGSSDHDQAALPMPSSLNSLPAAPPTIPLPANVEQYGMYEAVLIPGAEPAKQLTALHHRHALCGR